MVLPICLIFVFCSIKYYQSNVYRKISKDTLILLWLILFTIVALRPEQMADFKDYKLGFDLFENNVLGRWEPLYWLLMKIIHSLNANFIFLLFAMGMLSVGIRLYAIKLVTPYVWGSIIVYLSNLYILHDMIQIRCAVASGLLILAIYYRVNKQRNRFLITSLIAFLFHYSAIIIFPLWFIDNKINHKRVFISLIPLSYILVKVCKFHPITIFSKLPLVGYYIEIYSEDIQQSQVNIFNGLQLIRCAICIILWLYLRRLDYNKYFIAFLKIYTIGLCCLPLFSDIYVVAYRVSEFFLVSEIIVIPYLAKVFMPYLRIGKFSVISIASIFLLMNIYYTKYLI